MTAREGLALREIARVMGMSANGVRNRLYRARARSKKRRLTPRRRCFAPQPS